MHCHRNVPVYSRDTQRAWERPKSDAATSCTESISCESICRREIHTFFSQHRNLTLIVRLAVERSSRAKFSQRRVESTSQPLQRESNDGMTSSNRMPIGCHCPAAVLSVAFVALLASSAGGAAVRTGSTPSTSAEQRFGQGKYRTGPYGL